MNGQVKNQSIFLKILRETFKYAENVEKDIREGDLVGAATRFVIIALGFFPHYSLYVLSMLMYMKRRIRIA